MKYGYDPEFDSPEARANFATRHIRDLYERVRRRNELLEQFRRETVVQLFPGHALRMQVAREHVHISLRSGEETHSLSLTLGEWDDVRAGRQLTVPGSTLTMADGRREQEFWRFNHRRPGSLEVYRDSGRMVFEG